MTLREASEFTLREGRPTDYDYVEGLYVATMQPLLRELGAWDEADALGKFRSYFKPEEIQVIQVDGVDVGFWQVVRDDGTISLDQIHIEEPHCSRGIGSALIRQLQHEGHENNLPVLLSFVTGNRAQLLYQRLGFCVVGKDDTRTHMRWNSG